MSKGICVIAIGGNAILNEQNEGTINEQIANLQLACEKMVELIQQGYRLLITHGNGPQVGQTLLRHKLSSGVVCEGTLDTCGAETQGLLGYLIQQGLHNALSKANIKKNVVSVITQVLVDKADQAFANPTKPIGPFYTQEEAQRMARQWGKNIVEDSGRGYRLVVPSPRPIDIIEKNIISALLESDAVVIAAGGGGIPVICEDGRLTGVEAVVDKDSASSVLADLIGADYMLLLTGVEQVSINFKQPNEQKLAALPIAQAEQYLLEGQFPEGSMAPKIRAAVEFVKQGGKKAIITTLPNICLALQGKTGTTITV